MRKFETTVIDMEVKGNKGTATVKWVNDGYNYPCYKAFITVPFQPSGWVNLYITDKKNLSGAIEKAKYNLECALERCTLC